MPLKLLILTDGITPFVIGGMQKHSFNLTKQLALQGHSITLFHCVTGNNKLPERDDLLAIFGEKAMTNIESICLRFPSPSWYPGHYLKESYIFSRMIYNRIQDRLHSFDFIYAKGFTAWYFLEQKKKGKSLPPIGVKFHGYEMFQPPVGLKMRIENYLLSKPVLWNNTHADFVFSYGGKITDLILSLGVSRSKIIEVPTGIDPEWIRPTCTKRKTDIHFCFVGRNERRKGIAELHLALKSLPDQGFQFHFIGPIPASQQIKQSNITYHGALRDSVKIQEILDQCQVLVVPSHSEGMPNVIMEGMARGLSVIGTPVGAVECLINPDNGWLVEPGNSEKLGNLMRTILGMADDEIEKMQLASLRKVADFTWDEVARQTAEHIRVNSKGA